MKSRGFSRISKIFSRFSRFLAAFVYLSSLSSLSSVSYFATTENQILHAYKDWTGLISTDDSIISSADVSSSDDISSESVSDDISEDIADMAVSNDIPASSDIYDDNEFDNFVSHDTNDTGNTADTEADTEEQSDTEGEAEDTEADSVDSGNTVGPVAPVAPVPSGPDEDNNTNTPNNENNENNPDDSDSIAVLTTRLTSDHHLIATLSISGVMGADVMFFPNTTGPDEVKASGQFTSAGGNIYTVSNVPNTLDTGGSLTSAGSSAVSSAGSSSTASSDNVDKPDSLLLNFENEEGVVESVRLWLDNEIDETVILDGITASNDTSNSSGSSNDSNFSSRAYDGTGSNGSNNSQSDLPRLAVPLSEAASSDLAASTDTATAPSVLGYSLESFIGLDQISSPIIVVLPSTNEQYYFANGKALAAYDRFDQEYRIAEIRATTRAEIEIRLVRK